MKQTATDKGGEMITILAKFFIQSRTINDPDLDILDEMDELWKSVYGEHRSTSFGLAALKANEAVLTKYASQFPAPEEKERGIIIMPAAQRTCVWVDEFLDKQEAALKVLRKMLATANLTMGVETADNLIKEIQEYKKPSSCGASSGEGEWASVKDGLPEVGEVVDIWEMHTTDRQERYKSLEGTDYFKKYCMDKDITGWRTTNMKFHTDNDDGVINIFTGEDGRHRVCVENGEVTHWKRILPPQSK